MSPQELLLINLTMCISRPVNCKRDYKYKHPCTLSKNIMFWSVLKVNHDDTTSYPSSCLNLQQYKQLRHQLESIKLAGTLQNLNLNSKIKTHDSESRGQEEAGRTRRTSELFTRSTALKFVNALNKPP